MKKLFIMQLVFFISGCVAMGSKIYKPPAYASQNFKVAIKNKMPSDILKNPSEFKGKQIHWIGILKGVEFIDSNGQEIAKLRLSQKYWDYVEDISIQTERIFLSPKGGGDFFLLFKFKNKAKFRVFIKKSIEREDLMFVYGEFLHISSGLPVLKYINGSFVDEKYYSTKIWQYDIKRDKNGDVVTNSIGVPEISNFKVLKVPHFGKND